MMADNSNCTSVCANQTAGRSGQKGGKRTETLYTAELEILSDVSVMFKVMCSRVTCRGSPVYLGYYGTVAVKATVPHIYNILFLSLGSRTVRLTVV
jgi:hypothetical protein